MSYLVLARKYRPKSFTEMVGQEHVVQALTNALTTQRLHHAYLFTGTRGVGKTTISRVLAKSLNCIGVDGSSGITAHPCGVCPACTAIDAGRFADYTELDAASNRGVDEVQSLLEQAVYKPVQGRFKVFMIDEVHMLTTTAFNAMLKTLEEPPEYLKFVLATTDPQKVPVTVLSRCLQFNLRPMAPEMVQTHLESVLQAERIPTDAASLRLLAKAARGSMRDALSLTDQAIAFGNGELQESAVRQMLGSVDRSHVFRLIEALVQSDGKTVVETVEVLRIHGLSAASTLEEMAAVLQRMAVLQSVPAMAVDDTDPETQELARLAARMPADETQLLYSICLHGRMELGLAPDEYAALTMVLLRLLAFKPKRASALSAVPVELEGPAALAEGAEEKKSLKTDEQAETPNSRPAAHLLSPAVASKPIADPVTAAATKTSIHATIAGTDAPAESGNVIPSQSAPTITVQESATADAGRAERPHTVVLPVRKAFQSNAPTPSQLAQISALDDADNPLLAMPVRVQSEPLAERMAAAKVQHELRATPEGDFWNNMVQQLLQAQTIKALARELALQSQLLARDSQEGETYWLLRVEREVLNQAGNRDKLEAALADIGHRVSLSIEIGSVSDSPAIRMEIEAASRQSAAEAEIKNHPFVQDIMQLYGAKIVPGTVKPL